MLRKYLKKGDQIVKKSNKKFCRNSTHIGVVISLMICMKTVRIGRRIRWLVLIHRLLKKLVRRGLVAVSMAITLIYMNHLVMSKQEHIKVKKGKANNTENPFKNIRDLY